MVTVGLWVRLEAKVGRERELEVFLRSAMPLVDAEAGTLVWLAYACLPQRSEYLMRLQTRLAVRRT
jgi:hypothetical protein